MRKGIKSSYIYRWSDKYRQLKNDALKQLEDSGKEVPQVLKDWYNNPDAYDEYEDEDEYIKERYEFVDFKYIQDEDGFSNTYYMYYDNFEDKYVFVFDEDDLLYENFDWEEENKEAAEEWFDCYGNDECDIYSSTKINASTSSHVFVVIKTGMNPKVIGVYGNRESAETEVRSHKDGNYNIMPFAIQ